MWEAIAGIAIFLVGGFVHLTLTIGRITESLNDIKNNHLPHIYESLNTIQATLMRGTNAREDPTGYARRNKRD